MGHRSTTAKTAALARQEQNKARMLAILTRHVGAHNACDMARLYEQVFNRPWNNKINDTRRLRRLVTQLRDEGVAICASTSSTRGGYYLAATPGELNSFLDRSRRRALKILGREARMRRVSLAELLGQLRLSLTGSMQAGGEREADHAAN